MTLRVIVQLADSRRGVPHARSLGRWAQAAFAHHALSRGTTACALTIRVVGSAESRRLNRTWRGKDRATNVLSFPAGPPLVLPRARRADAAGKAARASMGPRRADAAGKAARASMGPRRADAAGKTACASMGAGGAACIVRDRPAPLPVPLPELGDLAICAPVVAREARQQRKTAQAHWAHMVVHGVLHLLGYDHENDRDAGVMEACEAKILKQFGYLNPYA